MDRKKQNKTKNCKTCVFNRTVEISASRGHTPEKGASMCDRWGCDFRQHVGIDTSAANVWQALVITLLFHLITILRKAASVRTRTRLIQLATSHTKQHVCNIFTCRCAQYRKKPCYAHTVGFH